MPNTKVSIAYIIMPPLACAWPAIKRSPYHLPGDSDLLWLSALACGLRCCRVGTSLTYTECILERLRYPVYLQYT